MTNVFKRGVLTGLAALLILPALAPAHYSHSKFSYGEERADDPIDR